MRVLNLIASTAIMFAAETPRQGCLIVTSLVFLATSIQIVKSFK